MRAPFSFAMIISHESAKALENIKRMELAKLTREESLAGSDALLALAAKAKYPDEREQSAGIIECQRILYNLQ
jgi:hypothetical protein